MVDPDGQADLDAGAVRTPRRNSRRSASAMRLTRLDAAAGELVVAVPGREQQQLSSAEQHAADRGPFDQRGRGQVEVRVMRLKLPSSMRTMLA